MNKQKKWLITLIPIMLALTLAFGITSPAQAVEFDEDGFVGEDEVIDDDLFIAGDNVEINGIINGDLIAAGAVVTVNGEVHGSLVTGAQSVRVNGIVDGSVYSGSSTFTLGSEAQIGRNLYYGGFNLALDAGSEIDQDLLVGAYQALLEGSIGRNVKAGVGALDIMGTIGGDVYAEVAGPDDEYQPVFFPGPPGVETIKPAGIRISDGAEIGGKLTYTSSVEQTEQIQSVPAEGIEFNLDPEMTTDRDLKETGKEFGKVGSAAFLGSWVMKRVRLFLTLLLLGGLAIWQLPDLLGKVGQKVEKEIMPSLGWGIVTVIVVYVGAFIIAGLLIAAALFFGVITLGGLSRAVLTIGFSSLGLGLASFGLLMSYVSKLVVAVIIGRLLMKWLAPEASNQLLWSLLIGVFVYTLLRAIPFLGGFIGILVTFVGIGAMFLTFREWRNPKSSLIEEAAE